MIKHIWSVLCRESVLNQDDNNLSLYNTLESLQVNINKGTEKIPEVVAIPMNYEVVSFLTRPSLTSEEKIKMMVSFLDPELNVVNEQEFNLVFPKGQNRMRTRLKFFGITAKKAGLYVFFVKIKQDDSKEFEVVAELPLEITIEKGK